MSRVKLQSSRALALFQLLFQGEIDREIEKNVFANKKKMLVAES